MIFVTVVAKVVNAKKINFTYLFFSIIIDPLNIEGLEYTEF